MKKIFENPMITIDIFNEENVVTGSGTTPQTAEQKAADTLNKAGSQQNITVQWAL